MGKLKINHNIPELRRMNNKMSGEELAKKLTETSGKSYKRSTINNWESGYRIKDEDIINICKCFHISADDLLFTDLGKTPAKFRSDDDAAVDAAKYTGLSHKAIMVLHDLHNIGFDLNALSTLLERLSFYYSVISRVDQALKHRQYISDDLDDPVLSDELGDAAVSLTKQGYFVAAPREAFNMATESAASSLKQELKTIQNERDFPSIQKLSKQNDKIFFPLLADKYERM